MGSEMCIRDSVRSVRPCGSSSALDHSTEALERHLSSFVLLLSSQLGVVAPARLWITAQRLWNDTRLHLSSYCPVRETMWHKVGSLDHRTEALERHPPSLVLLLSSQRGLVARARLWIIARRLWSDTRLHSSSSFPVRVALWLELGSGSQHGGFGATPAFTRSPLVQSARPCGLNTALCNHTSAGKVQASWCPRLS